jgi:hypothetical protein
MQYQTPPPAYYNGTTVGYPPAYPSSQNLNPGMGMNMGMMGVPFSGAIVNGIFTYSGNSVGLQSRV